MAVRITVLACLLFASAAGFASNRCTYIDYGMAGQKGFNVIGLDTAHQQVFTAWWNLDRVDVLSTIDYHLTRSIITPSPTTLDISPDVSTIAVGNTFSTVTFYSTTTYAQTAQFAAADGSWNYHHRLHGNWRSAGGGSGYIVKRHHGVLEPPDEPN